MHERDLRKYDSQVIGQTARELRELEDRLMRWGARGLAGEVRALSQALEAESERIRTTAKRVYLELRQGQ